MGFIKHSPEWEFFKDLYKFCEKYSTAPTEDNYNSYWDSLWAEAKLLDQKYAKNTIYAARLIMAAVGAIEDREQEGQKDG